LLFALLWPDVTSDLEAQPGAPAGDSPAAGRGLARVRPGPSDTGAAHVDTALAYVGRAVERPDGSNAGPLVERFLAHAGLGPGHAWCAAFVGYVLDAAGATSPSGPDGDLLRDARTRKWITPRSFPLGAVLRGGRQVERGDVLVNKWTELRGHAELALRKTAAGDPLRAVGGNVSGPPGEAQGVWEKNRGPLVPTNRYAPEHITRPRY
jgi:hypothetical protein